MSIGITEMVIIAGLSLVGSAIVVLVATLLVWTTSCRHSPEPQSRED